LSAQNVLDVGRGAVLLAWIILVAWYVHYGLTYVEPRWEPKPMPQAESVCDYVFVVCEHEKEREQ
jgi:hypothetical protein